MLVLATVVLLKEVTVRQANTKVTIRSERETGDRFERSPEFCTGALEAGVGQIEGLKRCRSDCACYAQVLILLVSGESGLAFITENSVDRAVIIPKAGELRLYCVDNCVAILA